MALTMDNAYHTKIVTNNEPGADITDMELRKLLFAGSILLLPASAGAKAGIWVVMKVNGKTVACCSLFGADGGDQRAWSHSALFRSGRHDAATKGKCKNRHQRMEEARG